MTVNKKLWHLALKTFFGGGLAFWLSNILIFKTDSANFLDQLLNFLVAGLMTSLLWIGNGWIGDNLDKKTTWTWTEHPVKMLLLSICVTTAFTLLCWFLVTTFFLVQRVGFDFPHILRNLKGFYFLPTLFITIFITTFMYGRSFLINWKNALTEAERLKKEQIATRYEVLQAQVNPHFLFNSLNVLTTLVHKDANEAERFVRQLSSVYRYVLASRESDTVLLSEEIEHLEAYLYLMKIRFGEALLTHIDCKNAPETAKIVPLCLQMLVENAIKHNEISRSYPLSISIICSENNTISVKNNVQKRRILPDSTGFGLENITARYGFLSDKKVTINEREQFFEVVLPIV